MSEHPPSALLTDVATERRLLGAFIVGGDDAAPFLKKILRNGLRPDHFFRHDHAQAFRVLTDFSVRGVDPEVEYVVRALADLGDETLGDEREIRELVVGLIAADGSMYQADHYAKVLRDLAARRAREQAAGLIAQGSLRNDQELLSRGMSLLLSFDSDDAGLTKTRQQLADDFIAAIEAGPPERFKWPWPTLNRRTGGGAARRQIVVRGGWTGGFKSVAFDIALLHFARQSGQSGRQLRVHSYINEQSHQTRMERMVSNLSGVLFDDIATRALDERKIGKVMDAARRFDTEGFSITDAAGWDAEQIATHMMMQRYDVVGVDILHEIAHRDERDLAHIAQVLRAAAKQSDCLLIMTVHLNDARLTGANKPVPVLRDVRGSGMIVRCADLVCFVHREDDEDGDPTDTGVIKVDKNRNGTLGSIDMYFDGFRMDLREQDRRWAA